MAGWFLRLFWLFFLGSVLSGIAYAMPWTFYRVLSNFGLLLVVPIGLWIAGNIFLILKLSNSRTPWIAAAGQMLGAVWFYTALLQGVIYCVLVFMAISVSFDGAETIPATRAAFIHDLIVGTAYLSCFVYGASAFTTLFTVDAKTPPVRRALVRAIAIMLTILTIGGPLALLLGAGDRLKAATLANPVAAGSAWFAYLLVMSALLMQVMNFAMGAGFGPGPAKRAARKAHPTEG